MKIHYSQGVVVMRFRWGVVAILAVLVSSALVAQDYPMPGAEGGAPVTYLGKPTYPYGPPFKRHVGRIVDSHQTKDWQAVPFRTLRAQGMKVDETGDRIFMMLGSHLVSYKKSTFFTSTLGKPLTYVQGRPLLGEQYLQWDAYAYPEEPGSGWRTHLADDQIRLTDFHFDDRGYVYAAYSLFGWGLMQQQGSNLQLIKQFYTSQELQGVYPKKILAIKGGGKYYALVADEGGSKVGVWDTTNATTSGIVPLGTIELGGGLVDWEFANDTVAVIVSGVLRMYTSSSLVVGGPPVTSFSIGAFGLTTDGSSFYSTPLHDASTPLTIYKISPHGATFNLTTYPTGALVKALGLEATGGYVTVWANDSWNRPAVKIFRATPSGLVGVPLGEHKPPGIPDAAPPASFLTYYYTHAPSATATAPNGYAKPGYCAQVYFATVYPQNGKDYLIYFVFGVGDVFELQTRDAVDIDRALGASPGTANPNAPNTDGPFYGDLMTFTSSTSQGSVKRIRWDFANPESGAANAAEVDTGNNVAHRYVGISNATAIATPRNVTAVEVSDTTNGDSVTVTLKVPTPRIKIKGTTHTITSSTNASSLPIVVGDTFVDASDGTVEGHYDRWQFGTTTTLGTPLEEVSVGVCGAQTLTYSANYVPYTGQGATIAPTPGPSPYVATLTPSYTVRPFVPAIQLETTSPTATTLTFKNMTRIAAATHFAKGSSTPVRIQWEIIKPSGTTTEPVRNTTLGNVAADSYTVQKSAITAGSKVVMTLTIVDSADIVAASCRAAEFVSAKAEMILNPPDPQIVRVSGCQYTGGPCELRVESISNASRAGWTYQWYVEGSPASGQVSETFSPTFTSEGNRSVTVTATNVIGSSTSQPAVFAIVTPPCQGVPSNLSFSYTGCAPGNCKPGDQITLYPFTFGRPFQECDTFKWETDGRTFNERTPTLSYATEGTKVVKLTVSNSNGSAEMTSTIQIGNTPNPNNCNPPPARVDIIYSGAAGCQNGAACTQGQAIQFHPTAFGYNFAACPDSFVWQFGDSTTSSERSPSKVFSTPGTYEVNLRVSNSGGATNATPVVIVVNPIITETCPLPPASYVSIGFSGAQSQCAVNKSCNYDETITFTAYVFGAPFQDCHTLTWSFGDGTFATGRTAQKIYTNRSVGTYTVKLTITNPSGANVSKEVIVNVSGVPISAPTNATITQTASAVVVGTPATFVGAATSPEGPILEWEWKVNAVKVGSAQTLTYTFENDGQHELSFRARNAGGWSPPAVKIVTVQKKNRFAFLLPVVAHIGGNFGSLWRTDLQIFNPDPTFKPESPLLLTLEFRGTTGVTKEVQIDSATYIKEDLYRVFFATGDGAGTVIVSGNAPFAPQMWTRTYNVSASGVGTFGQLIPAIRLTDYPAATTNPPSYILAGLQNSAKYRTNLGIINPTNTVQTVSVEAFDDTPFGFTIGKFDEQVNPYSLLQFNPASRLAALANGKPYSLKLKSPSGAFLVGYASMIDNTSGDPVFVEAIQDDTMKGDAYKTQILPGVGRVGSWRSDVTIFNPDTKSVLLDLSYYDGTGAKVAEAKSIPLAANAFTQIPDLLKSTLWTTAIPDTIGVLRIDNPTPGIERHPIIFGRTYNDQGEKGTFGQGIPAFAASLPNVKANSPGYLPGVRSDSNYRTNIGLTNLSSEPTVVKVTLLEQKSGQAIGNLPYLLQPFQSVIGPDILRGLSASAESGTLKVEIVLGGPVWAFASIVDRTTSDPEYVPAIPTPAN